MFATTVGFRALLAVVAFFPPTQEAKPQEQTGGRDARTDDKTRVVILNHANGYDVVKTLRELGTDVSCAALDHKQIVLSGRAEKLQEIYDQLIAAVDVPSTKQAESDQTAYIQLGNLGVYGSQQLTSLLGTVIAGRATKYAVDSAGRTLVIQGNEADVEAARNLVKELGESTNTLTIHFSFLRGQVGAGMGAAKEHLPEGLWPVAEALLENGVGELSLMAPVTVRTDVGSTFTSSALLRPAEGRPEGEILELHVKGSVLLPSGAKIVVLEVAADVGSVSAREASDQVRFTLKSTLTTEMDAYTVLTAAPASTADGSAIALVVRVTKE